jgi:hypothetical protein
LKALDFVNDVTKVFGEYNHDKNCEEVIRYLFNGLIDDMSGILELRAKVPKSRFIPHFFAEVSSCIGIYGKHLGSILKEINLKAEKINKLGKYGFSENWFQHMFIKRVKEYNDATLTSTWKFYFPGCKEMEGVDYPAFNAIKEFLNP